MPKAPPIASFDKQPRLTVTKTFRLTDEQDQSVQRACAAMPEEFPEYVDVFREGLKLFFEKYGSRVGKAGGK